MKKAFLVNVDVPEVRHYTFTYRVEAETEQEAKDMITNDFDSFIELEPYDEILDDNEWLWEKALVLGVDEE